MRKLGLAIAMYTQKLTNIEPKIFLGECLQGWARFPLKRIIMVIYHGFVKELSAYTTVTRHQGKMYKCHM